MYMNMGKIRCMSAALALTLALGASMTACNRGKPADADGEANAGSSAGNSVLTGVNSGNAAETAKPETAPEVVTAHSPTTGTYEPTTETVITLGDTVTVNGVGATADGRVVTVTNAGAYLISGTLTGGQIIVDTADEAKVTLILNGASVSSTTGPAVYVKSAPKKVVICTAAGSVNILSDGADYVVPDEAQMEGEVYPNACLYACDDLELDGEGELHITGNADKGINTKDDLKIKGGTLVVTSVGVGIRANDSLELSGGTVTVLAGGDGVKTANTETEGKGYMMVTGGALYVTATGDGLSAATDLTVSGGNLVITTQDTDGTQLSISADGLDTVSTTEVPYSFDNLRGPGDRPGGGGMMGGEATANKASISAKGLKAGGALTVSDGKITITAMDDGLHSDGDATVTGGTLYIRAADDGIHAEGELTVSGGVIEVAQSYEGLEALHVNILGGTNRITSTDDGINATDGSGGGMMGGMGGWGGIGSGSSSSNSQDTPLLTFAGGYTVINAAGDGIDSNGNIVMTGGTVLVYGPTSNGNGAIDSGDGNYGMTISGGTLLAVGSSGMAETAENAGQAVLTAYWNGGGLGAGETVGIVDGQGNVLAAFSLPKAISSIVFSSPDLTAGNTYTIVGGGTTTATVVDGVIDADTYTGYESMGEIEAR